MKITKGFTEFSVGLLFGILFTGTISVLLLATSYVGFYHAGVNTTNERWFKQCVERGIMTVDKNGTFQWVDNKEKN